MAPSGVGGHGCFNCTRLTELRRPGSRRFSMRALATSGKGQLQMIGRGLKLDVEDRTEEELRGMLADLWRSWTPGMILDKLIP